MKNEVNAIEIRNNYESIYFEKFENNFLCNLSVYCFTKLIEQSNLFSPAPSCCAAALLTTVTNPSF